MAACGMSVAQPPSSYDYPPNCDDCLRVVKTTKTVHVPCQYNTYKQVKVKVPRQVKEQVPRTVKYTEYETCEKQVPYTVTRPERRTRIETQKYQVPVKRCYTVMQTKKKQVEVPYYVDVPCTKYRTETHQVPVEKSKVYMDCVTKTVYDEEIRRRCIPQSRWCSKELPLYSVVPKPCGDCPADCLMDGDGYSVVGTAKSGDGASTAKIGTGSIRGSRASKAEPIPVADDTRTIGASTGITNTDGTLNYYDVPQTYGYDVTYPTY